MFNKTETGRSSERDEGGVERQTTSFDGITSPSVPLLGSHCKSIVSNS